MKNFKMKFFSNSPFFIRDADVTLIVLLTDKLGNSDFVKILLKIPFIFDFLGNF